MTARAATPATIITVDGWAAARCPRCSTPIGCIPATAPRRHDELRHALAVHLATDHGLPVLAAEHVARQAMRLLPPVRSDQGDGAGPSSRTANGTLYAPPKSNSTE